MGKWDTKTLLSGTVVATDDRLLISDQSQADGSQDRNITRSALSLAIPKYEVSETAHGLSVGDAVRFDGANYVEATADTAANAEVIGLVVEVPDVDTLVFQQVGYVTGLSGLTAGDYYYLQDAGGLGATAGTVRVPMLLADDTTSGWLVPLSVDLNDGDMLASTYDTNDDGTVDSADVATRVEETVVTANSGASYALDCATGSAWVLTLTDSPTLSFSNVPTGGFRITVVLTQDGTGNRTVTWPASVQWASGTAPTLSTAAAAVDVITLFTPDSGSTWYGATLGLNFS